MTEAMDMDGRLDQLVRAGLMPTSSLPLLKRAISRMHAGMSLQGAERDVMNMFISSMMFIVLGDDTVFNKARAGAKGYAAEEVSLDEENNYTVAKGKQGWFVNQNTANGVHNHSVQTGYHDSKQKAVAWAKNHAGSRAHKIDIKEAKEKTEYDYEGDMAMGQLKSIIANSQRMHDMLSDDTNLPEWVQSKITLAEDYISTASNYMQGEMNEEKMPFEGPYRKVGERKDKYGNPVKNVAKHLAKKAMNAQKNEEVEQIDEILPLVAGAAARYAAGKAGAGVVGRTVAGAATKYAVSKSMNKEEVEITEASVADVAKTAHLHVRAGKHDSIHTAIQSAVNTHFPSSVHSSVTRKKVAAQALNRIQSMNKSKMTKEEVQIDELSKKTMGSYVKKASGAEQPKNVMSPKNVPLTKIAAYQGDSETGHFGKRFNQATYDKAERLRKNRETGIKRAVDKITKEEVEQVDEISKATMGRYINKAKDSIDMTSYRSGIKDGTAISSSTPYKSNNPLEKKLTKRHKGISMAVKKLTKEDIDAVKQMNESYKTAFETALNEYGIKSPSELDESKRKEFFNHVDLEFKKGDN
jgi:hypothetical protein